MVLGPVLGPPDILVLTPDGPLQKKDFENLAAEVDPFIEANGDLAGVMIWTASFPGWESFAALVSQPITLFWPK